MRLATYRSHRGPRLAGLVEDRLVDLSDASRGLLPTDMVGFIAAGPEAITLATRVLAGSPDSRLLADLHLGPPLMPRRNVFCLARNYLEHLQEGGRAYHEERPLPKDPTFFTKPYTTVIGPEEEVPIDGRVSTQMDYEVELAVVIGTPGKDIPAEQAFQHVFGYTIGNDVSARTLQRSHGIFKGKSLDRTCPLGPWVVTADEVPPPPNLGIRMRINGELRQGAKTGDLIFDIPAIIRELSRGMTLLPGDVILTGTPAGTGLGLEPQVWLKPGDLMEAEIEGIGVLRNRVVDAS